MVSLPLEPLYENVKSYYFKACVIECGDLLALRSYGGQVVTLHKSTGQYILHKGWNKSTTTIRHVREFLAQNGHGQMSKSNIFKNSYRQGEYLSNNQRQVNSYATHQDSFERI